MRRTILVELAILIILIITAVCMGAALFAPAATPALSGAVETQPSQAPTQSTQTEPTEPEPTWMTFPEDQQVTAKQYFVYDVNAKQFLTISGNQADRIYPASVTKLFTCYVALQYLDPEQVITVGDELDMVAAGSSVAQLRQGDQLTVSQLVEAMLLPSGNDAAHVLAANAGRVIKKRTDISASDAVAVFMTEMNRQATAVGMTGAHFANPDGIHRDNHYMTFADLAVLGTLCVSDATILKNAAISVDPVTFIARGAMVGEGVDDGDTVIWENTNQLINPNSPYYCPYATGLKTGQTPRAGSCLLSSFAYEGKTYIIGVFNCPDVEARFADTLLLFNQTIAK